jgi:hypothetical protein
MATEWSETWRGGYFVTMGSGSCGVERVLQKGVIITIVLPTPAPRHRHLS